MSDGAGARAETMSRSRVPQQGGRTGGLRPPVRLLVLLVDDEREAARLHEAWMGQAIDLEDCPSLAVALVRIGQAAPDMVVVGATAGSLGCGRVPAGPSAGRRRHSGDRGPG